MDASEKDVRQKSPRDRANIFSLLTFSYLAGLWKKAYKHNLHDDNLYDVLKQSRAQKCGDKLEKQWTLHCKSSRNPSVARVLWKCWGGIYILIFAVDFLWNTFISIIKPYVLGRLVAYFVPGQIHTSKTEAYLYAIGMLLVHIAHIVYTHNYDIYAKGLGIEIKTSFSSLLYRKALKLSPTALTDVYLGNIVSLITRDVHSFVSLIGMFNQALTAVTQVVVICCLLYFKVGLVSFIGIGVVLLAVPLQIYLGTWITKLRLQTGQKTDERLQITQEILSCIRIIKMYTWEPFFTKNVNEARRKEVWKIVIGIFLKKLLFFLGLAFTSAGLCTLLIVCVSTGVATDASIIYYIASTFRSLGHWLVTVVPHGLESTSEFISAYKRIVKALTATELKSVNDQDSTDEPLLELKDVTVSIKKKDVLKNVSLKISSGLTVITGAVGSGKSSIFKTFLRDYPATSGLVLTEGRISYASQEPWLFPSTIKQNILFGEPYDEQRYQEVVRVCALSYDFNLFENGDETILIDRGLNFSKGQQSRINLARAVYKKSDIYLLDDCLAALDATVQDYIFRECIKTFLKDKICVLITQTANQINETKNVIIVDNGKISKKYSSEIILQEPKELTIEDENVKNNEIEENYENEPNEETKLIKEDSKRTKIYSEIKKQGSLDLRVYKKYFIYGGGTFIALLYLIFRGCTTFTANYTEKLLGEWVDKQQVVLMRRNVSYYNDSLLEEARLLEKNAFKSFAIFLVVSSTLEITTKYVLVDFFRRVSTNLHKAMFGNIMKGVMYFFDSHLIGNILNRCSQDMFNIDESLSYALDECSRAFFSIGGIIILLTLVNTQFVIIAVLILIILLILRRFYIPAGRCLKRLEASTRSPMIGHLNATLEGLTTIRASRVQKLLIMEFDRHLDLFTSAHYLSHCSNSGFGFFVDMISSAFVAFVLIKFLFFQSSVTAGRIGLSLTQVISLTSGITGAIRQWSEVENNMTSLERVLEYTDIETEKIDGAVIKNWPSNGSIIFKNVYLSYSKSKNYVLKNLNFEIQPREKIGIVGRTGAGKTSIISAIFRLYETEGEIFIDGTNTKILALDFLRKNIAVITQDPVLFSGNIRTNLDPLKEFEDHQIWEALEKVGLKSFHNLEEKVDCSNFSCGQKQLICLARAILRKTKIVIMDEVSANMDNKTDAFLHEIVKNNFSQCTILIIAHRLQTIMESDKVLVLDKGMCIEFDSPKVLLGNKEGMFYKMVKTDRLDV